MSDNKIRVTLVKSTSGRLKKHQACVAGLGLRRIGHMPGRPVGFRENGNALYAHARERSLNAGGDGATIGN